MQTLTFKKWMAEVDKAINAYCGLSHLDLADCCYRDWYEDGITPTDAAKWALEENCYTFGE